MGGVERRRTDRLLLTIPLRVEGADARGREFEAEGRTAVVNRHGARIQLKQLLQPGQTIRVVNLVNQHMADFRVIGPTAPFSEKGGEWGVEAVQTGLDIWGIQFPPAAEGTTPRALLECRQCHKAALVHLSLVEVEVLEKAGIFSRVCEGCGRPTPWGYAEKQMATMAPPGEAAMLAEAQAQATAGADRRQHRRVSLQLPVLVRDFYGGAEINKSENVSKTGFCFASEKTYQMGEAVVVVCPYDAARQKIEVRARIVRILDILGTRRRLYGVRYDGAGT